MGFRILGLAIFILGASVASAAGPSGAQEKGAEAFLNAVASGNAQAIAQEIHPDELDKLRSRLVQLMQAEASRSDNTYRSRLFGQGRSLSDLQNMTSVRFYGALSDRLRFRAREFQRFDWLAAVPGDKDKDKVVFLVGFGIPPKERGAVRVNVTVGMLQYGSLWKAAIPTEVEAQIDDLLEGRVAGAPAPAPSGNSGAAVASAPAAPLAPGISELLTRAEGALVAGNCEQYYSEFMSPNFQKYTSRSARKTLVTACTNNESSRETMITTLRIVQELSPKYDLGGSRAVYDVSGQGLPYERFALERDKDMKWYIAE